MPSLGKRSSVFAVADIGSGSGGVCILETHKNGPARILACERCTLSFEERSLEATIGGIVGKLTEAAQKAVDSATKNGSFRSAAGVYTIVRGPWTRSKAIRVSSAFPQDTKIDENTISALAKEALSKDTELDRNNIMEANVVRVELNGYETAKPLGKIAHNITVAVLLSDLDQKVRAGITEALGKTFSVSEPKLRSGLRALLATLHESADFPKDCVLIDMTSDATHVVAVRKGVPAETAVVKEGKRSILKRVAADKMPEDVLAQIRLMEQDRAEPSAAETIKAAMASAEPELVRAFGETMTKLANPRRLPNAIIIAAHEDILPWMARFFARIDFAQFTVTLKPFTAKMISPQRLSGLITVPPGVNADLGLLLASSLVNIEQRS